MHNKKYDLAVIVSNFQPFTMVDLAAFQRGYSEANHVLVIQADCDGAIGAYHPFSQHHVYNMVHQVVCNINFFNPEFGFSFSAVADNVYSPEKWLQDIQWSVQDCLDRIKGQSVLVINFNSQKHFPQWDHVNTGVVGPSKGEMLDCFYEDPEAFDLNVPNTLVGFYREFRGSDLYKDLVEEHNYFKTYDPKAFDVSMLTTDAVVTCLGHILLVERKFRPGKGLLALPGGFLKKQDWPEVGVIRELKQETRIDVSSHLLKSCMGHVHAYGDPNRSMRGRVLTLAAHVDLDKLGLKELPRVKGADDAKKATWVPFGLIPDIMFEDHRQIINKELNIG